jgi:hypothetical protein
VPVPSSASLSAHCAAFWKVLVRPSGAVEAVFFFRQPGSPPPCALAVLSSGLRDVTTTRLATGPGRRRAWRKGGRRIKAFS